MWNNDQKIIQTREIYWTTTIKLMFKLYSLDRPKKWLPKLKLAQ